MVKKNGILFACFAQLFFGSFALSNETNLPDWIQKRIEAQRSLVAIEKYRFKGSVVDLVQTECCDCGSLELYSEIGKLICRLPDSLFGLDDSNCPGFNKSGEWVASAFNESEVESKVESELEMGRFDQPAQLGKDIRPASSVFKVLYWGKSLRHELSAKCFA